MTSHVGEWLRAPLQMGGVVPSGRALASALASEIARCAPRLVLEVGTGTGVIARAIAERLPHARVVGVDLREGMLPRDGDADPAEYLRASAAELPLRRTDAIVSSLPFGSMPRDDVRNILTELARVSPNFVAYQYSRRRLPEIREAFPTIRVARHVLRNIPPAYVLSTIPRKHA